MKNKHKKEGKKTEEKVGKSTTKSNLFRLMVNAIVVQYIYLYGSIKTLSTFSMFSQWCVRLGSCTNTHHARLKIRFILSSKQFI